MTDFPLKTPRHFVLTDLQDEINRLFDFSSPRTEEKIRSSSIANFMPAIDIQDKQDHYLIFADLPGVDPKEINVTLNNNMLTIRGEKDAASEEKNEDYVRTERSKGAFCRQFILPEAVDSKNIAAKSKNGVLEVRVPKTVHQGTVKINIET